MQLHRRRKPQMLTVELRVNGNLIGHVQAVNQGYVAGMGDKCNYEYTAMLMETGDIVRGRLQHERHTGAFELIRRLAQDIGEKSKKGGKET